MRVAGDEKKRLVGCDRSWHGRGSDGGLGDRLLRRCSLNDHSSSLGSERHCSFALFLLQQLCLIILRLEMFQFLLQLMHV